MDLKGRLFYSVLIAFAVGVAMRSFVDLGSTFSLLLVVLAAGVMVVAWVHRSHFAWCVAFMLVGLLIGIVRFDSADVQLNDPLLDSIGSEEVVLTGVVLHEPRQRVANEQVVVTLASVAHAEDIAPTTVRVIVTKSRFPKVNYGDEVRLVGQLRSPERFETEAGRVFDYPAFLAKDGIGYQMFFPEVAVVSSGHGNALIMALLTIKRSFVASVGSLIPEPHAALLSGLVVGAQEGLGEALLDMFRVVGLIHIVVLSGYNITIVSDAIMRLFHFVHVRIRLWVGVVAIILFALLVGLGATVVRASIMAGLVLLARGLGRSYNMTRALLLAGVVMVAINPHILMFDPSFQLSFLATLGLIYIAPHIEARLGWVPTGWQLREFVTATLATQIFVLPLLLYSMGTLSVVSVVVNVLVLPIIPATMLLGFIAGAIGVVSHLFALPFAFGAYVLLGYELAVVKYAAVLPFASVTIPSFGPGILVAAYAFYIVVLYVIHTKTSHTNRV